MAKIFIAQVGSKNKAKVNKAETKIFKLPYVIKKEELKEELIYGLTQSDAEIANASGKCACKKLGCSRGKLSDSIYCMKHAQMAKTGK